MVRKAFAAILMSAVLAGCGAGATSPSTSTPPSAPASAGPTTTGKPAPEAAAPAPLTHVTVEMPFLPGPNQLPYYLALHHGYYKAQGLDVKIVSGNGSAVTAQQVAAGNYDLGSTVLSSVALTRAKGGKITSLMAELPRLSFGVFTGKDTGITTWKGLYGHSVAVSPGSAEEILLPATFKKLGLDIKKVRLVSTHPADKLTVYVSGKTDAAGTDLASYGPVVQPKRPSNYLWFGDVLNMVYLGLFARDDYIQSHHDTVKGFVAATVRAMQDLQSDPAAAQEAAQDMMKDNPGQDLSAQVQVAAWALLKPFMTSPQTKGHSLGYQPPEAWKETLQILHDYSGLKGDMNADDYFTNAFLPAP